MKKLIIYHADLDGYMSALGYAINDMGLDISNLASIPKFKDIEEKYDLFFVNHGPKNILEELEERNYNLDNYSQVILVDFSFTLESMNYFIEKFGDNFIWIDHHKRTYEEYESKLTVSGLRDNNHSASVLVWKYFNKEPAKFARYVQDQDIWIWKELDSKEILAAIDVEFSDVKNLDGDYFIRLLCDSYFDNKFESIYNVGKHVIKYRENMAKLTCLKGKTIEFEGYNTFIVNTDKKSSEISSIIFNDSKYKDIDVVFTWFKNYKSNFDKMSLRSKTGSDIDVSKICVKYGGNGHKYAAGISTKKIEDVIKM